MGGTGVVVGPAGDDVFGMAVDGTFVYMTCPNLGPFRLPKSGADAARLRSARHNPIQEGVPSDEY